MLNSIYFLLTVILVVMLLYWSLRNDKATSIDQQKGLFAMRTPDPNQRRSSKKQPYVPGQNVTPEGGAPDTDPPAQS